MTDNVASFRAELDRMAAAIDQKAVEFQRLVVLDLFTVINMGNPVGNPTLWKKPRKGYVGGHSRRNWRLSMTRGGTVKPGANPAPLGGVDPNAQSEAMQLLVAMQKPTTLWLSNPVPYMDRLEQGWSRQQPTGWLLKAVYAVAQKYNLRII